MAKGKSKITLLYECFGGPHDGANVKQIAQYMPDVIFLSKRHYNDRAVWNSQYSVNFPHRYLFLPALRRFDYFPGTNQQ